MQKIWAFLLLLAALLLSSCTTFADERQAAAVAMEASQRFANQEYASAQRLYADAVALDPGQASYQYNAELSLLYLGEYAQVTTMSEASFQEFPAHLPFLFLKARALGEMKHYEEALQVYGQIFRLNPALYEARMEVAELALQWGMEVQAKDLARSLVNDHKMEKEAFALLSTLEGEESWYGHIFHYLTKEDAAPAPESPQVISSTEDVSSSDEVPIPPTQDTELSL